MICRCAVSLQSASIRLARPKSVTCGLAAAIEQDVRWLQVAVEDATLVGVVHGLGDRTQSAAAPRGSPGRRRVASARLLPSMNRMLK